MGGLGEASPIRDHGFGATQTVNVPPSLGLGFMRKHSRVRRSTTTRQRNVSRFGRRLVVLRMRVPPQTWDVFAPLRRCVDCRLSASSRWPSACTSVGCTAFSANVLITCTSPTQPASKTRSNPPSYLHGHSGILCASSRHFRRHWAVTGRAAVSPDTALPLLLR